MSGGAFLTDNDKAVIRERRHGWEQASASLLARVFGVSVQCITAICKPTGDFPHCLGRPGAVRRESTAPDISQTTIHPTSIT